MVEVTGCLIIIMLVVKFMPKAIGRILPGPWIPSTQLSVVELFSISVSAKLARILITVGKFKLYFSLCQGEILCMCVCVCVLNIYTF